MDQTDIGTAFILYIDAHGDLLPAIELDIRHLVHCTTQ